jgi:hypothetical protein
MPQSLANFDDALKDDYGPGLREAVNYSNPVWSEISTNTEDIQGRQAVWTVHIGQSTSTGARGELQTLPTADRNRFKQVRDNLAYLYHTIKVSGPAIALTKNDRGSFTRALESELRYGEKSLKLDCARQSYNAAVEISSTLYLGALVATASTAGTTTTQTFGSADPAEIRYFFRNMAIDVINGTDGSVRGSSVVTAIDPATKVITFSPAVTGATTGDYLARQGNWQEATAEGGEMNGLRHILSDTDVYANVDPSTTPEWATPVYGDGTEEISEIFLDQANQKVQLDGDGGSPDLWLAAPKQVSFFANKLRVAKRFDAREMKLKAGWTGVQIAQGMLVEDRFNPETYIFGITKSELSRFVGEDFTWDDIGGTSVLYKALDGTDAVEGRFKAYQNLEALNRNSHVVARVAAPVI